MAVLVSDTFFTRETTEVTIQATIRRVAFPTRVARREVREGKSFMHHELIGELPLVLNPMFEVILYTFPVNKRRVER